MVLFIPILHWERLGSEPGILGAYLHGAGRLLGAYTELKGGQWNSETGLPQAVTSTPLALRWS